MPVNPWTAEEEAQLAALYPTHSQREIGAILGRTEAAIAGRVTKLGIRKPADYMNTGRFAKGALPWNTGIHYTAGGRSAETRFKKGHRGGRALDGYQPIGTERITKDGYLQRKVNDDLPLKRRWKMVHVLIWEATHGPVPARHIITFRDGNKRNFSLDNLECISMAENMRRNSVHNLPKPIAQLVLLRGALVRKINHTHKEITA